VVGRVFVAVPPPDEIKVALVDQVRDLPIPGRRVPPPNWHLTLRFLGPVDDVAYERFLHGLSPVEGSGTFPIVLQGLGAYPTPQSAAVVWVGVGEGTRRLGELSAIAETAVIDAGLPPEDRPFHPHLTLSRVRPPEDVRSLLDHEVRLRWQCDRVVVYLSRHGPGGAIYEPLETVLLKR
jgi:RNA 2',3'-cyclic 3'-phosphodiesterase